MFKTVAEAYAFYKNSSIETMESRSKAIQAEISTNAAADIQAFNIELEGIENAMNEKRGEQKPAGYTTPEDRQKPQHPGFTATESAEDKAGSKLYRSAFYKHLLGNELSAEERRIYEVVNAEKRADAFNNLTNAAAVVPTKLLDTILVKARDQGGLLSISRGFNMPANIQIPIATPGDAAEWHTEGAKVESEKVEPTYVEFAAYEIMKVLSMSVAARTMTIDAFESYLADELSASVMACLAQAMVNGDGNAKGTGIIPGVEWVNGENWLLLDEDEFYSWQKYPLAVSKLHRGYSNGARWVMNNATLYQDVISLHDDNNDPLFIHDLTGNGKGRLLGFEVVIDDYLEDHDVLFGNFDFMGFNIPNGLMLDVSRESSFKYGLVDYRAMAVADCKPIIEEAFVRLTLDEA